MDQEMKIALLQNKNEELRLIIRQLLAYIHILSLREKLPSEQSRGFRYNPIKLYDRNSAPTD